MPGTWVESILSSPPIPSGKYFIFIKGWLVRRFNFHIALLTVVCNFHPRNFVAMNLIRLFPNPPSMACIQSGDAAIAKPEGLAPQSKPEKPHTVEWPENTQIIENFWPQLSNVKPNSYMNWPISLPFQLKLFWFWALNRTFRLLQTCEFDLPSPSMALLIQKEIRVNVPYQHRRLCYQINHICVVHLLACAARPSTVFHQVQ